MANCIRCGRQLPAFTFKKICQWCVQHEAAQRGEDTADAKQIVLPAPWVRRESSVNLTQVILGANVMVFIAMVIASGPSMDFTGQVMVHFGANFGRYTLSGQWWRLLTYMFLHGGLFHIAMNMWCLWNLGTLCESLYGRWTYAAVYLITGVAGGLASVGWNPGVLSVGASGALFGLTGALIASFYLGEFSLSGINVKGTLSSLLFFAGFSLFMGRMVPGIDNACHVGGLVSGLILGALIARVAPAYNDVPRRLGVILFGVLLVSASAYGVWQWRGFPLSVTHASEFLAENKPDQAISELQKIVRKQPDFVPAHFALAHAYFSKSQYPQAEGELKRVLELQPQHQGARFELGMAYLSDDRPKDAQDCFAQLLSQDANDADAHSGMGMAQAAQGDHLKAIEEFKTALQMDPGVAGVNYEMGRSYAKLKRYDEAIAAYLKQRERDDDSFTEGALADAYEAKGMTQEAQAAKNKAAQLKSGQRD